MDSGRQQQLDKKQLLQQQQLLLQKQLQQQQQHQHQQQQHHNLQQLQLKQQQQQLKPQQQPVLQAQAQYLQQQLSPNQQQLQTRNQDFLKQRGMQHGNLNQQQLQEHQKNQDQAIIELLELNDNNKYENKNQEDCLIVQREQVIQPQQQSSLQRQQPLKQLQSQLMQQSQLGQQQQHQQQTQFLQQSQQQFQNVQQLQNMPQIQNLQQLQTVQQPQLITQPQIVPNTPVVGQPSSIQKPNSLQQSQISQLQNNQYSPVSTQQQSKKQPPPHTQQLLQQQLQQLLLKNKSYPQRIVVLGNQPQQQQLSLQQPQRVVTSNSTGQQSQQMQCVVVTNTGQQPQQMQRVVVTGTGQQQQQQQIQRVMVGNNGQQQPQQMQRVVVTSTSQQIQQQQIQHVVIPCTSQQQSHQVQNVVTQTSIQQQPQQLQRVVVAPTGQQQIQRVVTSTSSQQQLAQQHQPVQQRIVIGQLKTSQQTQQMHSPAQNGAVLNQQVMQRPIGSTQQQQRVVIAGQQQILKLTNQQQSQQQITLQKQLTHKLLQPIPSPSQQQDVVKNQQKQLDEVKSHFQQQEIIKNQQQQDVVKNQQKQLDEVNHQQKQQDVVKNQHQQDIVKKQSQQVPHQQLSHGIGVPLTQQQKHNLNLFNDSLAKELHIKQSHQLLQQLHIQPSQKHSQEQINKQLQLQKLKQKKEIDQLQQQLKQPQRSGLIVGQLQQPEKPEPEKLKKQLEMQQQQRQKLQERLILQQRQQQQKLKEQQLQQKHQQQLREQVLLQQHLKQLQQQQLQKKLLLRQQASPENRLSLAVNGNQDQKIQNDENTINRCEKSEEAESLRHIEKVTAAEKQYQLGIKRKNNEKPPVGEKEVLLSSSDDDDDETIRKQRILLREAERLVQERYDALTVVLGSKYITQYDEILKSWLASQLSREEFDREIRKVLYVSWIATKKHVDSDNNSKNASIKTNNNSYSKKTTKKDVAVTTLKIKEDNGSLIDSTAHKSPTLKKLAEINEDINVDIEKKEVKAILAERVPLHNALVTSLIKWMPLNCQWLEQQKARSQGVSVSGAPLRLYTYADVPQVRGQSDHWYPDVPGSLAHWYWPNNLPCKSSAMENIEHLSPKMSFYEQEKKKVADAVAAAVLIKPPSRKLLPLLMEVAENTEKLRRARQLQYQKRFPKNQNAKITKRLQWQRLQEQKRLTTMVQLRDGCSKLLRELKMRLRCLANQEDRLIERLRRLQIRMSRRRRQVLAQFKIRQKDLKSRLRKFFDRSYIEQPNVDSHEHLHTDGSSIEDNETDDDENSNEEEPVQHWKEVHQLEKNHGNKKKFKTTIANHQSKLSVRAQRPQSTALTIRLLRDRQLFLATTRLLEVTKQERLHLSSNVDYVREVRNKNCPCGESDNRPCQYWRQIRKLRKKLRARELIAIKKEMDQELVRKSAEREKIDAEELQKTAVLEVEKTNVETKKTKDMTKLTNRKNVTLTKKNINAEAEEKEGDSSAKEKIINNSPVKTNATTDNNNSKTSLDTTNPKNVEIKVRQIMDSSDKVNKGKHNMGIHNCNLLPSKCPQKTRIDILGDAKNRIRPPLPKDKRSVVNVADAAARAAQAALAASKKTQLRKTRAAAAAAAAAATTAAIASPSGIVDNDRRASELMPPPPPPPPLIPSVPPKSVTNPRNPTIGARYLQQQKFLLDRHRQLERIRRDEEERRQRAQDEGLRQDQECFDREVDETNMKMEDSSSPYIPSSQEMKSKRQKVSSGTIVLDMNRVTVNEEQADLSSPIRSNAKNGEETQQFSDYYFYYGGGGGGGDYYSSDEESSGSSFIEPPFPPLLHDLRIDQLPRPTNRMPAAAVLPPGVRTRLQPMRSSNSNIHDVEQSASYNIPQVETRQEQITKEADDGRNINDPVAKQSLDCAMEFSMRPNSLSLNTITDTCKITEADEFPPSQMLSSKMSNKSSKESQNEVIVRREQQKMQQDKINDTKMLPERRKRRQDPDRLSGVKKTFDKVQQQVNENLILKTNPSTEWSKRDSKQVSITSTTKMNSYLKDKNKHLNNQLQQQKSMDKIIKTFPSSSVHDTKVDVEELRSVQWKAPLTQWNKRPVEYEEAVKQRYPIPNKGNDLQHPMNEKVVEYISTKFEVSKHHQNNEQQKLQSEVDRQKCERIKLQNMVFEYQKLVDTLPINEQLQHMIQLQQHLRTSGNMIEEITVNRNPPVEQQQNSVASTSNSYILLDDSTTLLNLPDDSQEQTVSKRIGNLLLKIKNQQEEMILNAVSSDQIKRCPEVVSNNLDVNNAEQNDLKNWRDLWPAYEGKLDNDELMDEEQRLCRTQELIDQYYFSSNDQKSVHSLDQQKRRLGRYGQELLEKEPPAYQQLRMKQTMPLETPARPNITDQQILKPQNLQNIEQHLPERQKCLDQYKRLERIEQLDKKKHLSGHRQQQINEQIIQKSQNNKQTNSGNELTHIQQQRSQLCLKIAKFQMSPTLCYDEQLPLRDQLLRRIMKKKNLLIINLNQQQQHSKPTAVPDTRNASNANIMKLTSRGSRYWWSIVGLQRQISPLVKGNDHRDDLELTPMSMTPISNLPQLTRPQLDDRFASVIDIRSKNVTVNESKLKKWMTPHLINMMTNDEEIWVDQLQTKISQLDQQVDQHWEAMIDGQQQQVKLLVNYDKRLQWEKEKKRLERERQIQQLKKRTPFQALPVHHQQTHTLRGEGQMQQQQSEIPIIVIDDDDEEELLNDTTVVDTKQETHTHPVFIDDDLLKHKIETKVFYEDQHEDISIQWKKLEVMRKANQKQWELKIKKLYSYKAANQKFWREMFERLMSKIKNPNLIKSLEELNGGPFRYSERTKLQLQMLLLESQPNEKPGMFHCKQKPSQKQAVKNRSQKTPTEPDETSMLIKKSKKTIKLKRSTLKLALQKRPLYKQGEQKYKKNLPQHLNDSTKSQLKKSHEHQEAVNIRQLRSKRTVVVNEPSQKRTKRSNHQNQSKPLLQKKAIEQQEQFSTRWFQHNQMLMKIKTPAVTLRHIFLLRNRILQVNYNRNKRLRKQNQRSVPKQDINIDSTEMQTQQSRNKTTKLVLKKMAYTLHNQRSLLQRQLDRLNENHPNKIDEQLEPPVSKTMIMSVRQPLITSLILPPLQTSTIKPESLTSTVVLSPQQPLTSIDQSTMSSIMLKSQIPIQPNQPISSNSANQPCQQKQQVENKRQILKQQLNIVHSRLKPLMEMWRLSLQMPGSWLCQQLDDIEQLRRKEFSNTPMLQLMLSQGQQQKQETLQNNEVSVMMDSNAMTHCSLQQLQRIREHLDWRQQRLRDLIDDLLILICPEQHPMLSMTSQQSSSCSVLIKLQQNSSMAEQINSKYSALLNLQSPSSWKHVQQQFFTYSLLLKLKQPMTAKQQSLVYSTILKLQQPPMPKQSSCLPMTNTTLQLQTPKQQQSISFVSENLMDNSTSINNKPLHIPNNQIQEKRRLSSGDETDDGCKRLKSSSKKRPISPNNTISNKRSVPSLTKNTGIDKSLPIIDLVDSDDDIEILDSDSSTESSNEASFGVQVSEKSPLTIKFIKKKPIPCAQSVIPNIENKSELNELNSVIKLKKNINNIDLDKGLEETHNEYSKEDKMMQLQDKGEDFKTLKSNEFEDNKTLTNEEKNSKDVITGTSVHTTIVSRPTQISVLVNRPNEASAINKPFDSNNQIFKVAVVECSSSMISNVGSNCINVVPEGRDTIKIMGGVINPTFVNSADRTISVISKLTEAAVSVIRKTPAAVHQHHKPADDPILTPMNTPISNLKMTKSMEKPQSSNNGTEGTIESIKKNRIVTTNDHCRTGTFSKTARRYRRLNRTRWLETRGPAVPTFQDHGFPEGTIEQVVHGRFVTTIMTMSSAHTIASYIPPPIPRIPFDYASMYQPSRNMASTAMANSNRNVDKTNQNQNIKTANTSVTPLSTMMSWIEKTAAISSNIACGNGHLWKGCARASGPTLMTLSKVTKEAISRNTAIRSRDIPSSHLTNIPARLSRSSTKEPTPLVANSTKRSVSETVPTSPFSNSNGKQQTITKRSTSLTLFPSADELHDRSKSALVIPSVSRKEQSNSVIQPTKRSASEAFSSVPLTTSKIMTGISVPALETKISTSKKMIQPQKRSKSAVTTTNTSIIDVSSTLTKPSQREECLWPLKRSASVAEYVSPSITSKISGLSLPAVESHKRSMSAAVITPVVGAAAASNNNFIQSKPIKKYASNSIIQPELTLPNATIPELNILKTLPSAAMLTATPNDAKNNVFTNSAIETSDESDTAYEKTTTITDEEQRTVTVTRTICPTIPAPMDVTADACSLVKAACEQFIKSMVMELRLKTGRGSGMLELRRRDAFAAAVAVDDEIRPFPDYCRTPAIGTTIVNPSTLAHTQREINVVEKEPASEQISITTDNKFDKKFIVMTTDKPDHENEHRVVLKQQSIIADSKSNNKLSLLTVKTVIETQTTSSTTTTINKLHCPTTITTDSTTKTKSSRSVIEGTSARTRGTVLLKKSRNSASTSESTIPSSSEQQTTGDRLSVKQVGAGKRSMSPPPVIAPQTTVKPPSMVGEATKTLPDATLTFNTSKSTRRFFVDRSRSLWQPTFNRRQPFDTLVDTAIAANSTSSNNTFFSDDCSQDVDKHLIDTWGCYFSNQKMLPPLSRLNNFLNFADKLEMPSSEYHDGGDTGDGDHDTVHQASSNASTKLPGGIKKLYDNNAQEKISFLNDIQQLNTMQAYQKQYIMELEEEMNRRVQEHQSREPDSQKVYYQKFLKLQFGSTNKPPEHSMLRFSPNDHNSLINW